MRQKQLLSHLWTCVVCAVVIWGAHDSSGHPASSTDAIEIVEQATGAVLLRRQDDPFDGDGHAFSQPSTPFYYPQRENLLLYQSEVRTRFSSAQSTFLTIERNRRLAWHARKYQVEEPPLLLI